MDSGCGASVGAVLVVLALSFGASGTLPSSPPRIRSSTTTRPARNSPTCAARWTTVICARIASSSSTTARPTPTRLDDRVRVGYGREQQWVGHQFRQFRPQPRLNRRRTASPRAAHTPGMKSRPRPSCRPVHQQHDHGRHGGARAAAWPRTRRARRRGRGDVSPYADIGRYARTGGPGWRCTRWPRVAASDRWAAPHGVARADLTPVSRLRGAHALHRAFAVVIWWSSPPVWRAPTIVRSVHLPPVPPMGAIDRAGSPGATTAVAGDQRLGADAPGAPGGYSGATRASMSSSITGSIWSAFRRVCWRWRARGIGLAESPYLIGTVRGWAKNAKA